MLKAVVHAIMGALVAAAVGTAFAVVGTPPLPNIGFALQDGQWLQGLAGGQNYSYQSGISAAGTTQATATQLGAGIALYSIDTVASSAGVALPPCIQGTGLSIYNNGAQTLTVYPSIANNQILSPAAQDTINNGTSLSGGMATHTAEIFFCAKNGVWAAK